MLEMVGINCVIMVLNSMFSKPKSWIDCIGWWQKRVTEFRKRHYTDKRLTSFREGHNSRPQNDKNTHPPSSKDELSSCLKTAATLRYKCFSYSCCLKKRQNCCLRSLWGCCWISSCAYYTLATESMTNCWGGCCSKSSSCWNGCCSKSSNEKNRSCACPHICFNYFWRSVLIQIMQIFVFCSCSAAAFRLVHWCMQCEERTRQLFEALFFILASLVFIIALFIPWCMIFHRNEKISCSAGFFCTIIVVAVLLVPLPFVVLAVVVYKLNELTVEKILALPQDTQRSILMTSYSILFMLVVAKPIELQLSRWVGGLFDCCFPRKRAEVQEKVVAEVQEPVAAEVEEPVCCRCSRASSYRS